MGQAKRLSSFLSAQVTPLGHSLGTAIIQTWLADSHRAVTPPQWQAVQEAVNRCNLPLFIKLVFDEISRWRSYHVIGSWSSVVTSLNHHQLVPGLAHTIHDSIMKLFDRVEFHHGRLLVSHALGYITAAKGGLSAAELEDILSLDEKVVHRITYRCSEKCLRSSNFRHYFKKTN